MSLRSLSSIFKITDRIDNIINRSRLFQIVHREFILKSIEYIVEYSISVIPKTSLTSGSHIMFERLPIKRILIISSPGFIEDTSSFLQTNEGAVINTSTLDNNATEFLFKFFINIDVERIIKDLVQRNRQVESSGTEQNTYWLHAQLTNLQEFRPVLRRAELTNIPFLVNVGIHQDIKTKFPLRRRRELELIAEWVREHDRNKKWLLSHRHLQIKSQRPREKEIAKILNDLQDLFLPHIFKSFVKVEKDFSYYDCFRGADFYDQIPFRTFPKWMVVVSRTNLSIEKPAAEGELIYNKMNFQDEVEKAISKK